MLPMKERFPSPQWTKLYCIYFHQKCIPVEMATLTLSGPWSAPLTATYNLYGSGAGPYQFVLVTGASGTAVTTSNITTDPIFANIAPATPISIPWSVMNCSSNFWGVCTLGTDGRLTWTSDGVGSPFAGSNTTTLYTASYLLWYPAVAPTPEADWESV